VAPQATSVVVGLTMPLAATGSYSDGSSLDITNAVTWTSTDTTIASVSNASGSAGVVTGIAVGSAIITATNPTTGSAASTSVAVLPIGSFANVIGPTGGTVGTITNGTGISMTIPAGALSQTLTLTITPISTPVIGAFGPVYDIGPSGTKFATPVALTFPYTTAELDGNLPTDLAIGTVVAGGWQPTSAPIVDTAASTIAGVTTHLSPYTIIPLTSCPTPGPAPASGIYDFYSYVFSPNDPNTFSIYGEIIFYGLGCHSGLICTPGGDVPPADGPPSATGSSGEGIPNSVPGVCTGSPACGATYGLAGMSIGSTVTTVGSTTVPAFQYSGADLQLLGEDTAWNGTAITTIYLTLGIAGEYPSVIVEQDPGSAVCSIEGPGPLANPQLSGVQVEAGASGTWQFKTHWQGTWPAPGPQLPPSTSPIGMTPQGEFADPTSSLPDVCCPPGQTSCINGCTNMTTDPNNCGTCGNACTTTDPNASGPSCGNGQCTTSCDAAFTLCNGVCVNEQTDTNNCGGCSTTCLSGETCTSGVCSCASDKNLCANTCVYTQVDTNNCGSCGNVCPTSQICASGNCSCDSGQTLCGTTCISDLQTDPLNCGACGTVCSVGDVCTSGQCGGCTQDSDCALADYGPTNERGGGYGNYCCSGTTELTGPTGGATGTCVTFSNAPPSGNPCGPQAPPQPPPVIGVGGPPPDLVNPP
jgi:hypothetical protein